MLVVMPMVQSLRTGKWVRTDAITIAFKVVLLMFLAWLWVLIVVDQMPCFLGVPNCD